jgi:hypothetical protein
MLIEGLRLTIALDHSRSPPTGANIMPTAKNRGRTVLGVRIGLYWVSAPRLARVEGCSYCHAFNLCCRNAVSVRKRVNPKALSKKIELAHVLTSWSPTLLLLLLVFLNFLWFHGIRMHDFCSRHHSDCKNQLIVWLMKNKKSESQRRGQSNGPSRKCSKGPRVAAPSSAPRMTRPPASNLRTHRGGTKSVESSY